MDTKESNPEKEMPPRQRIPQVTLEKIAFASGAFFGFCNAEVLGTLTSPPPEAYFIPVIPVLPVVYFISKFLRGGKSKDAFSVTALHYGGYLCGEALELAMRNYL